MKSASLSTPLPANASAFAGAPQILHPQDEMNSPCGKVLLCKTLERAKRGPLCGLSGVVHPCASPWLQFLLSNSRMKSASLSTPSTGMAL